MQHTLSQIVVVVHNSRRITIIGGVIPGLAATMSWQAANDEIFLSGCGWLENATMVSICFVVVVVLVAGKRRMLVGRES